MFTYFIEEKKPKKPKNCLSQVTVMTLLGGARVTGYGVSQGHNYHNCDSK